MTFWMMNCILLSCIIHLFLMKNLLIFIVYLNCAMLPFTLPQSKLTVFIEFCSCSCRHGEVSVSTQLYSLQLLSVTSPLCGCMKLFLVVSFISLPVSSTIKKKPLSYTAYLLSLFWESRQFQPYCSKWLQLTFPL